MTCVGVIDDVWLQGTTGAANSAAAEEDVDSGPHLTRQNYPSSTHPYCHARLPLNGQL